MTPAQLIENLRRTGRSLLQHYDAITPDEVRWKEAAGKWSLLEILCHLVDEERDDFRKRVSLTLESPEKDWPPIDPEGWARERDYNECDLAEMFAAFEKERSASLEWLDGLADVDWSTEHVHPKFGGMKAGDLLASWAAHDLLHLRQIANTRVEYIAGTVAPYSTRYAKP